MSKHRSKHWWVFSSLFFLTLQNVVTNANKNLVFSQTTLTISPGSLDVPPDANEAGEPSYAKQRPLGTGFRPPPPRQEAPAAALRDLGRQRVTATKAAVWPPWCPCRHAGVQSDLPSAQWMRHWSWHWDFLHLLCRTREMPPFALKRDWFHFKEKKNEHVFAEHFVMFFFFFQYFVDCHDLSGVEIPTSGS